MSDFFDLPIVQSYISRIGASPRDIDKAVVTTEDDNGYPHTQAIITFDKDGSIRITPTRGIDAAQYRATEDEKEQFKKECVDIVLPRICPIVMEQNKWPERLQRAKREGRLYPLHTIHLGNLHLMGLRERWYDNKGKKHFSTFTYWTDGELKIRDPSPLPFFNFQALYDVNSIDTVFLNEGEKSAHFMHKIINCTTPELRKHPWYDDLQKGVSLGWIGGATNSHRSDWKLLNEYLEKKKVKQVYVVLDNDAEGRNAIYNISKNIRIPTYTIEFPLTWKKGFDIADDFPPSCWDKENNFIGPKFSDSILAATWATEPINTIDLRTGKEKTTYKIRKSFADQWYYVVETGGQYVNRRVPSLICKHEVFSKMIKPFSNVSNAADLLIDIRDVHCAGFTYQPGGPEIIIKNERRLYNQWRSTYIKPIEGDITPFLKFVEYLITNKYDKENVLKWFATLIAKPEIKMLYALLLVSELQGTGKDTFAYIAQQLVGNFSNPTAQEVVDSQFNGWIINKSLVVVSEIYQGHSWSAYNKLKSLITQPLIEANIKHLSTYTTQCHAHFWLNSNSPKCLRVEDSDRRILMPEVTNDRWSEEQFDEFYHWLKCKNGLGIILKWCQEHPEDYYVKEGHSAPYSSTKRMLIMDSINPVYQDADAMAEDLEKSEISQIIGATRIMKLLEGVIQQQSKGSVRTAEVIDRFKRRKGLYVSKSEDRAKVRINREGITSSEGTWTREYIIINKPALDEIFDIFGIKIAEKSFCRNTEPFEAVNIYAKLRDNEPRSINKYIQEKLNKNMIFENDVESIRCFEDIPF